MELLGQSAQEPRARRGPIGCPVVVGAESPISAGRGDGSFLRVQGPLYAGMPALCGADAGTSAMAASELVDHAAGSCSRIGAVVIVPYDEGVRASCRVDGVAGAVGDDQHHFRVAGVQIVIAPADGPTLRNPRQRVARTSGRPPRQAAACDPFILRRNPAVAIRLFQEVAPVPVLEAVGAGPHDGDHPGAYG